MACTGELELVRLGLVWWCIGVELTLVFVLVEEEREKVKLAFVETVRCDCCDCCDSAEADRCRTSVLCCFLEWETARCGIAGTSDWAVGTLVCWIGATVKADDKWFGCGCADFFDDGDSASGLVGGVVLLVRAPSDISSSDLCEEPVEVADMGWISGALYESILVVWMSSTGLEILCRRVLAGSLVDWLRWGPALSAASILCLTLRVVNALAIDILSCLGGSSMISC